MAINNKLIHFKSKQRFNEELTNGNIPETSIIFILDTKEIYTHGQYYGDLSECLTKYPQEFTKEEKDQMLENLGYYFIEWDGESETMELSEEEYAKLSEATIPLFMMGGSCLYPTMYVKGVLLTFTMNAFGQNITYSMDVSTRTLRLSAYERILPTSTSDLENDSNFISSDNLKTINGESILGEGDIVISGGGGSGAYAEVNHGTSDTTFVLTPNTFHVWDEVATLDLSFAEETAGVANEYLFQFTSGAAATTLTLPDVKWANDSAPTILENMIYQVSVLKGLGSVLEFDNAPSLIENKVTVSISKTKYLVSLQYAAASDIVVKVRTMDGGIFANIASGQISGSAKSLGPILDSNAYIESVVPESDSTYIYTYTR